MTESVSSAITTVSNAVDLAFPAGFGMSGVAVGASNSLQIGDRVSIFGIGGTSPGAATNAGPGSLTLGNDSKVGALASIGDLQVRDRARASSATSAGTVTLGNQDQLASVTQRAALVPLVHRYLPTRVPSGPLTSLNLEPGKSGSPTPGSYDSIVAKSGASLTLSAGDYVVNSLDIEPQATVTLDTTNGTIRLFVANSWIWHAGTTVGDGSRFVVVYLGSSPCSLEAPFRATVVAPSATLNLATVSGGYEGMYYGKDVVIQPGVTVTQLATPFLIDSLTVADTALCPGQITQVTVKTATGASLTPWIQGVVGSSQYVQFGGSPGLRSVVATVYGPDGRADFARVPITVKQCTPPAVPPVIVHFWGSRGAPGVVDLSAATYNASGIEIPITGAATYAWTFGDGQTATTTVPSVEHNYAPAIDHLAPYSYFTASVAVTTSAGTATAQKVVSIWSLYAANRAKGIVQPPSTFSTTPSTFALTVTNYEATALSITQAKTELIPCDPALDARPQAPQALAATVPANGTASVTIAPPTVTPDVCAIGLHLLGTAAAGAVRTDAYVRVGRHNALTRHLVSDSPTIALLNQASTLTADPNRFDENELRALVTRGELANLPAAVPPGAVYANVEECNPEDSQAPGFACTPTSDWVIEPPEMLNAFKGNFIMDHGCGSIGKLLSSVGQLYSHTSIVVKNRVEVRHASAAGDRMEADVEDTVFAPHIKEETMRNGFPGTEGTAKNPLPGTEGTHSIDEMTHEYGATDPEGRTWRMGNEFQPSQDNKCDGDITAVPPLVIRPDPKCATQQLDDVAARAKDIEGHYRFFMYSRADMAQSCTAPWCAGQKSSVCSLFARDSAAGQGARGNSLWPNGPIPNPPPSVDGMRPYSVDTRTAGANAYFWQMHDSINAKEHPWSYSGLTEFAATNIANQMVNCFASDGCGDSGDTWEENGVGSGIAVSPDDMIQWDSCNPLPGKTAGTYGYNEPAVYLSAVFRHKYTLGPAVGSGRMTVVVKDDSVPGNGIAGVTVILDSEVKGRTGSNGSLEIAAVPAGGHIVEAQQYKGPALTPLVLTPTPEQILAMPACPAFPDCQASDCPSGWTKWGSPGFVDTPRNVLRHEE